MLRSKSHSCLWTMYFLWGRLLSTLSLSGVWTRLRRAVPDVPPLSTHTLCALCAGGSVGPGFNRNETYHSVRRGTVFVPTPIEYMSTVPYHSPPGYLPITRSSHHISTVRTAVDAYRTQQTPLNRPPLNQLSSEHPDRDAPLVFSNDCCRNGTVLTH